MKLPKAVWVNFDEFHSTEMMGVFGSKEEAQLYVQSPASERTYRYVLDRKQAGLKRRRGHRPKRI